MFKVGKTRMCRNRCKFCFVDQLPPGARASLLEKDDDWRMSLLFGNYVTFTNVSDKELTEIIENNYSPLYVSVHASDTELRARLLNCPAHAADIMTVIDRLSAAGIVLHAQIVLCPGINDGAVLINTVSALYGKVRSLAIVPVGITKYQKDPDIIPVTPENAREIIATVNGIQEKSLSDSGTRFVWCSDEMYQRAGLPVPDFDFYEDFDQIGNGVGMIAQFTREFDRELEYLSEIKAAPAAAEISVATGVSAFDLIRGAAERLMSAYPAVKIHTYKIVNNHFGESVTVAGLTTGGDLAAQLKGKPLGERLIIPDTMLRAEGDLFLDDMTLPQLSAELKIDVQPIETDGATFADSLLRISI